MLAIYSTLYVLLISVVAGNVIGKRPRRPSNATRSSKNLRANFHKELSVLVLITKQKVAALCLLSGDQL